MKNPVLRTVLLILGLCPFAVPLLWWFLQLFVDPWPLLDWLIFWSFLYWPTYVVGLALIILSRWKRNR